MEPYNKFSEKYNQKYLDMLKAFESADGLDELCNYVFWYPQFGIKPKEKCDILIYGQAVNGAHCYFRNEKDLAIGDVNRALNHSNRFAPQHNYSPIDWVNVMWSNKLYQEHMKDAFKKELYYSNQKNGKCPYEAFRSFFWQTAHKVVSDYNSFDRNSFEWSKNMVWSNLYKIAPERGANPAEHSRNIQRSFSLDLVKMEIDELNPKYVIVHTNYKWWQPFGLHLGSNRAAKNEIIHSVEYYNNSKIIVVKRPFTGNNNKYTEEIISEMN